MRKLKLEETKVFIDDEEKIFKNALKESDPNQFLAKYVMEKRTSELTLHEEITQEAAKEFWKKENVFNFKENHEGRVSPWAKEQIYRDYILGATIRDLSLKFGILPERVKAIIW